MIQFKHKVLQCKSNRGVSTASYRHLALLPVVVMEAPAGEDGVSPPGGSQSVQRRGQAGHQAGAAGSHHLHLGHHVVQPGGGIEVLPAYHHQHVLCPATPTSALLALSFCHLPRHRSQR